MTKVAFYCSGSASRVLNFYSTIAFSDYPACFVFYDGTNEFILNELKGISPLLKIIFFDTTIYKPKSKELSTDVSNTLLECLLKYEIDYLFCFGDKIMKGEIIKKYKNRIINFHPSLLPSFPGLNAIDQALNTSVQFLGNTAHFIDDGIDQGTIIMQSVIRRNDYSCYEDVLGLQIEMLRKIWDFLKNAQLKINQAGIVEFPKNEENGKSLFSC